MLGFIFPTGITLKIIIAILVSVALQLAGFSFLAATKISSLQQDYATSPGVVVGGLDNSLIVVTNGTDAPIIDSTTTNHIITSSTPANNQKALFENYETNVEDDDDVEDADDDVKKDDDAITKKRTITTPSSSYIDCMLNLEKNELSLERIAHLEANKLPIPFAVKIDNNRF